MKLFLCYTRNTIDIDVISEIPYEKAEGFAPGNSYEEKTETIKWLREEMGMMLIESGYYFFCKYDSEVDRVDITYVIEVYGNVGGPFSELSNLKVFYYTELFIYDKIFTGSKEAIDQYLLIEAEKANINSKVFNKNTQYPAAEVVSPLSTLKQAVEEVLKETITMPTVVVDGNKVAEIALEKCRKSFGL